jgi:hypothetical protein
MGLFDNFKEEYEKGHYTRHPKSKNRNILYIVLLVLLFFAMVRLLNTVG